MLTARKLDDLKVMNRIRAKLYAVNSYYANQDFKRANPNGRRYSKKGEPMPYNPYTLSPLTQEAREHYVLSQAVTWADDREARIKRYLTRIRLSGLLDEILAWEKASPARYAMNPWIIKDDEQGGNNP